MIGRPEAEAGKQAPTCKSQSALMRAGAGPRAFTLLELLIVVVIIGIVISLILTAAMDGVRRAQERATQGLISKLESGLDDRLQALMQTQPDYNNAHNYMAQVYNGTWMIPGLGQSNQRASVIALYDQIKAEVPDVFIVNTADTQQNYPLNFAGQNFPGTPGPVPGSGGNYAGYFLPLGNGILDGSTAGSSSIGSFGAAPSVATLNPQWNSYGTGIYGASYIAAAGFYKNLYQSLKGLPSGYDGIDNPPQNGLIDEVGESGLSWTQVMAQLSNHTHKTARAEALYAVLVEGQGPLGSTFNRDDFTDKEVQDTDGDGLPEFIDGWGEPLQFYRWPIYFNSDIQHGVPVNNSFNVLSGSFPVTPGQGNPPLGTMNYPYKGPLDPREQDTLDPSQQLMSPSWWSSYYNQGTGTDPTTQLSASYSSSFAASSPLSPGATAFTMFFHPLMEPMIGLVSSANTSPQAGLFWDRGGVLTSNGMSWARRAFFTKFLIASSGADQMLGIARLDAFATPGASTQGAFLASDLLVESQAQQMNFWNAPNMVKNFSTYNSTPDANPSPPAYGGYTTLYDAAQDDITNQNYQAPGGLTQ